MSEELKAVEEMSKKECIVELGERGITHNEDNVAISKRNLNQTELQECVKQARAEDSNESTTDEADKDDKGNDAAPKKDDPAPAKKEEEKPNLTGDDYIKREDRLMEFAKAPQKKAAPPSDEPLKLGKAKKGVRTFQNLIDHLRKSGTGRTKCDHLQMICDEAGDCAASQAVDLLEGFGMPPGTITKAQAFLEND